MIGIRELARHLEISIGTVSRALNGKADVNPDTRQRVMDAAAALGYTPNQSGRSLRKGTTGLVGVLIPSDPEQTLVDAVFAGVLDGLRRFLTAHGLDLAIFLYSDEEDAFAALRRVAERQLVDALIIANTRTIDPRIEYLLKKAIPFAAFGRSLSGHGYCWVDMDFEDAVDKSVERLVGLGHRRIATIVSQDDFNYTTIIIKQLKAALARCGLDLPPEYVLRGAHGETGGYKAGEVLLALDARPTAILTSDRTLAAGLYKRLNEAGVQIGQDIAIIGLHCDPQAQFLSPTLSFFQSDLALVGSELGKALLSALGRTKKGAVGVIATELVQSVVPVGFKPGDSDRMIIEG